jgi:hypothetical protein
VAVTDESLTLHVGDREVTVEQAKAWVSDYTSGDKTRKRPYSFPAYDHYRGGCDPDRLSDADFLAPMLLNVGMSVRAIYDLQAATDRLNSGLAEIKSDCTLDVATPGQVQDLVTNLYRVMDEPGEKPRDVGVTRLSKILHRKRPQFLVLHDRQVRTCYQERIEYPKKDRPWAQYMVELSLAIREDLVSQRASFDRLAAAVGAAGPVSRVRLLDIVAWNLGKKDKAPASPADD